MNANYCNYFLPELQAIHQEKAVTPAQTVQNSPSIYQDSKAGLLFSTPNIPSIQPSQMEEKGYKLAQ